MMTIGEVSKLTGLSIRTLQYYDEIGLLNPSSYTEAGYRLYDDTNLEKLEQIMLFRKMEFSLKEIKSILHSPNFDRDEALKQQIRLLTLKKEHLENIIVFASGLKQVGGNTMDFSAFDTTKLDNYATQAKEKWQNTEAYKEFTTKNKKLTKEAKKALVVKMMMIFKDFGKLKHLNPDSKESQALVKRLQEHISENYYQCSFEILNSLGRMYAAGGEFIKNIDGVGGKGTAKFINQAISIYCK